MAVFSLLLGSFLSSSIQAPANESRRQTGFCSDSLEQGDLVSNETFFLSVLSHTRESLTKEQWVEILQSILESETPFNPFSPIPIATMRWSQLIAPLVDLELDWRTIQTAARKMLGKVGRDEKARTSERKNTRLVPHLSDAPLEIIHDEMVKPTTSLGKAPQWIEIDGEPHIVWASIKKKILAAHLRTGEIRVIREGYRYILTRPSLFTYQGKAHALIGVGPDQETTQLECIDLTSGEVIQTWSEEMTHDPLQISDSVDGRPRFVVQLVDQPMELREITIGEENLKKLPQPSLPITHVIQFEKSQMDGDHLLIQSKNKSEDTNRYAVLSYPKLEVERRIDFDYGSSPSHRNLMDHNTPTLYRDREGKTRVFFGSKNYPFSEPIPPAHYQMLQNHLAFQPQTIWYEQRLLGITKKRRDTNGDSVLILDLETGQTLRQIDLKFQVPHKSTLHFVRIDDELFVFFASKYRHSNKHTYLHLVRVFGPPLKFRVEFDYHHAPFYSIVPTESEIWAINPLSQGFQRFRLAFGDTLK